MTDKSKLPTGIGAVVATGKYGRLGSASYVRVDVDKWWSQANVGWAVTEAHVASQAEYLTVLSEGVEL